MTLARGRGDSIPFGSQLKAEPIATNQFFQVLRESFTELYNSAANTKCRICVPHSATIVGATLNEDFFKSHILQSSPYFREEFVTLNGQCVAIRDGIIQTKTGFQESKKVKILSEELFYTETFESFTVYSVSGPLTSTQNIGLRSHNSNGSKYV